MEIKNGDVYGFEASIRAMRNPMNSWNKNDSYISLEKNWSNPKDYNIEGFHLGKEDAQLSRNLVKAGSDHRKHLRMIQVWADWILPRFVWIEVDTYRFINKISCSTMHKLMDRCVTKYDFEYDNISENAINKINSYINKYRENNNIKYKNELLAKCKNILPEGYLQLRTINTNYECLYSIYNARKNHKLSQWQTICEWISKLPYFKELTDVEVEK